MDQHLCDRCSAIFQYKRTKNLSKGTEDTIEWQESLEAVKKSAVLGCRLCTDLLHECESGAWGPIPKDIVGIKCSFSERPMNISRSNENPIHVWNLEFLATKKHESDIPWSFGHYYMDPIDDRVSSVTSAGTTTSDELPGIDPRFRIAKEWLHQCSSCHRACDNASADGGQFPTRIIEVRRENSHIRARLLEGEDRTSCLEYVTLSYRWSPEPTLQLLKNNLPDLKKDISLEQLNPLFPDIFEVVLQLGYDHVWIDALCIVQDSLSDWAHEATRMASVYQFAHCNIAVTTPLGSKSILTDASELKNLNPLEVDANVQLKNGQLTGAFQLTPIYFWQTRVDSCALNKRGWVFQERFLSPRILYLTQDQLLWECQDLKASEMYPKGIPPPAERVPFVHYRQMVDLYNKNDLKSILEAWETVRETYTWSALTYATDKLFAIAGIVKCFEELLQDQNIAGLWKKRFATELLWARDESIVPRPNDGRAPSWSWACIDTGSYLPSNGMEASVVASIRSIDMETHDLTMGGRVTIQAPLVNGTCLIPSGSEHSWIDALQLKSGMGQFSAIAKFDAGSDDLEGLDIGLKDSTSDKSEREVSVHMLTVTNEPKLAGLLLRRAHNIGNYTRIGYFHVFSSDNDHVIPALQDISVSEVELSDQNYLEDHGKGVYTVVLV